MKRPPYLALVAARGLMRFRAGVVMSLFAFLRMCPEIGSKEAIAIDGKRSESDPNAKLKVKPRSQRGATGPSSLSSCWVLEVLDKKVHKDRISSIYLEQ